MGGLGSSRPAYQDRHRVEKDPTFLSIDTATSARPPPTAGHQIQERLRHKRYDTTAGYLQDAEIFKNNAATRAGL
jgi:hypothetical protein